MTLKKPTRRQILSTLLCGAAAGTLSNVMLSRANAEPRDPLEQPLFVFVYFGGGWDTLLSLDPRDNTIYGAGSAAGQPLRTDYQDVVDPEVEAILAANETGLVVPDPASNIVFGPAIGRLADHWEDLCVVRGIDMGTVTHEVGRRHFITGKPPRGSAAAGSGLATWIAARNAAIPAIPNLVIGGMEHYNQGLDPRATGLAIDGYADLANVLRPTDPSAALSHQSDAAIAAHLAERRCDQRQRDVNGTVTAYRAALEKARLIGGGDLWSSFDFVATPPSGSNLELLYAALGVTRAADLDGPKGRVAVAAQAITEDLAHAASVRIVGNLDTHFDNWRLDHATRQREAFDAVAGLIDYLKQRRDGNDRPYWDRTTLVCFSEFARTPARNGRGGRDHHVVNSCVAAGGGIAGNRVVGASDESTYGLTGFDFDSSEVVPLSSSTSALRPADVHATVLTAMGLSFDHIDNQEPRIIEPMLA